MKPAELREMSDEQLQLTLNETEHNLFRLRMQAQTERLDCLDKLSRDIGPTTPQQPPASLAPGTAKLCDRPVDDSRCSLSSERLPSPRGWHRA